MIAEEILQRYSAAERIAKREQLLFEQGEMPRYYYQLIRGQVLMYNTSAQAEHFAQGLFHAGQSFGEPPLLGDFTYPASAIALQPSQIWRLPKITFLQLLAENPTIHWQFTQLLAQRLQRKSLLLARLAYDSLPERLLHVLLELKKNLHPATHTLAHIPLTRKVLAQMIGARLETTVRAIHALAERGDLVLQRHKIYVWSRSYFVGNLKFKFALKN